MAAGASRACAFAAWMPEAPARPRRDHLAGSWEIRKQKTRSRKRKPGPGSRGAKTRHADAQNCSTLTEGTRFVSWSRIFGELSSGLLIWYLVPMPDLTSI